MRHFTLSSFFALSAAAFGLSACGFTPMHAPSSFAGAEGVTLQQVSVVMADGRDENDKEAGFHVLQRLNDRIGVNSGPYTLNVTPQWRRARLGISANDVASRYDGIITANYTLVETKTGKVLDRGTITATSTFGASTDAYGVIASNDAAMRNTAEEAADRLIVKLANYFSGIKSTKP